MVLPTKKGSILLTTPPILRRLNIDPHQFTAYLRTKPDKLSNALGSATALLKLAQSFGLKFFQGMTDRKTLLIAG